MNYSPSDHVIMLKTKTGLKYIMSKKYLSILSSCDHDTVDTVMCKQSRLIESAEIFPHALMFACFVVCCFNHIDLTPLALYCAGSWFVGWLLSFVPYLFTIPLLSCLLSLVFGFLMRTFLIYAVVLYFSIVALSAWWFALIYFVAPFLLFFVFPNGYEIRKPFNDRIMELVLDEQGIDWQSKAHVSD